MDIVQYITDNAQLLSQDRMSQILMAEQNNPNLILDAYQILLNAENYDALPAFRDYLPHQQVWTDIFAYAPARTVRRILEHNPNLSEDELQLMYDISTELSRYDIANYVGDLLSSALGDIWEIY